ncbi:MAG: hypothetical protein H6R14_133 [Proteobacteria bacterium]|nr:hypothetical protein [Pseudomonadota bacterium]
MSVLNEKRAGSDRRLKVGVPPSGIGERRVDQRRQTVIADISFFEWATHFASFSQKLTGVALPQANANRQWKANEHNGSA